MKHVAFTGKDRYKLIRFIEDNSKRKKCLLTDAQMAEAFHKALGIRIAKSIVGNTRRMMEYEPARTCPVKTEKAVSANPRLNAQLEQIRAELSELNKKTDALVEHFHLNYDQQNHRLIPVEE